MTRWKSSSMVAQVPSCSVALFRYRIITSEYILRKLSCPSRQDPNLSAYACVTPPTCAPLSLYIRINLGTSPGTATGGIALLMNDKSLSRHLWCPLLYLMLHLFTSLPHWLINIHYPAVKCLATMEKNICFADAWLNDYGSLLEFLEWSALHHLYIATLYMKIGQWRFAFIGGYIPVLISRCYYYNNKLSPFVLRKY